MRRTTPLPAIIASAAVFLAGCGRPAPELQSFRQSRVLLGSLVEITLVGSEEAALEGPFREAFAEIERIDRLLGSHEQRGEVWALNERGWPGGVRVSDEVFALLGRALAVNRESGGAFDCTVGSLMRLWDFDGGGRVPPDAEIAAALRAVGPDMLRLDPATRTAAFTRPGVRIDLGAMGAGYAVDRAYALLRGAGVAAGIINAGGDLRVWGNRPSDGEPWKIGVQHPRRSDRLLGTLTVPDRAIVTSGDYEKRFTVQGRDYMHILDPATGRPATGAQSVTVVAPDAETADVWSTALMVMGLRRARSFLEGRPDLEAIIVDGDGAVWVSPGLENDFHRAD